MRKTKDDSNPYFSERPETGVTQQSLIYGILWQSSRARTARSLIRAQLYDQGRVLQGSCLCSPGALILLSESSSLFGKKRPVFAAEWFFSTYFLLIVVQGSKDLSVPLRGYNSFKSFVGFSNELVNNSLC